MVVDTRENQKSNLMGVAPMDLVWKVQAHKDFVQKDLGLEGCTHRDFSQRDLVLEGYTHRDFS